MLGVLDWIFLMGSGERGSSNGSCSVDYKGRGQKGFIRYSRACVEKHLHSNS
jgi:hypothetical protein